MSFFSRLITIFIIQTQFVHTQQRFSALDVFRGLTICLMIVVNTPGDRNFIFSPLMHAKWNGFTPADLVFPSFLFAVGNALSFVKNKWTSQSAKQVITKIIKRSVLIFLLGFLMYWFPFVNKDTGIWTFSPLSHARILGVLQRIAICYFFASILVYFLKTRGLIIISLLLLLFYWGLCFYLGTGPDPLNIQTNVVLKLDLLLMGESHLYHRSGIAFDPEGWLSTLPAIVNVIGGYLIGLFLQKQANTNDLSGDERKFAMLTKIALAGFILIVVGYFWDFIFPINKKLWTSSFVLLTLGLDCLILSSIIYLLEIPTRIKWDWFFRVVGKNPLSIYLFSELLMILLHKIPIGTDSNAFTWIYQKGFGFIGPYWGSLIFAICFMLLCWLLGYQMDKNKIYIKV